MTRLIWFLTATLSELRSMAECRRVNMPVRRGEQSDDRELAGEQLIVAIQERWQ